jgi:acetyl-CoA acetyltransferase
VRLGRAERHLGDGVLRARGSKTPGGVMTAPFGFLVPAHAMAMWARRYQAVHDISEERLVAALGTVAVTLREYAQSNPRAVTHGMPLTLDEHRDSRMIASPLRLYDLCRESDGGVALVVSAAADRRAVPILAASQHIEPFSEWLPVYSPDVTRLVAPAAVRDLLRRADRSIDEVDVMGVYDGTTMNVLLALEDFGCCGRGEAVDFVLAGGIGPGGAMPVNTSGGLLSEGHVHGLNLAVEAVRQMRGEADAQVARAATGLVTSRAASIVLGAPG